MITPTHGCSLGFNMQMSLVVLVAFICMSPSRAELPKTKPVCSTEWGLWWNAYACGNHPLHWAAASGDLQLARKLLDQGRDVNERDAVNWTPLNEAAFYGKQHLAVELVRRGADLKAKGFRGLNLMKQAKLKWCIGHSTVAMCPITLNDYDMVMDVLHYGCTWTECHDGLVCIGKQCWPDKCHKVKCGTNAGCSVEDRRPVCRCAPGFVGENPNVGCHDPNEPKVVLKSQNLILDICPWGFNEMLNQCLYIDDNIKLTWLQASVRCHEMGGYLISVKHPQKLKDYIAQKHPVKNFWVGGSDNETEGMWVWESGESIDANFPWGINNGGLQQPNNANNNEHCMVLKYFRLSIGLLYVDNRCDLRHNYICEADKLSTEDKVSTKEFNKTTNG